ncbi:MAG: hypothetical protein QNJ97_08780 [Myxococcota bacterium]|nr:hypothetical protein [Myxococcota bacterium]
MGSALELMGKLLDGAILFLYPVIVFFGLSYLGVRWTALCLLALTARRFIAMLLSNRETSRILLIQAGAMALIIGTGAAFASPLALRITPFAVSLTFIALFAASLRKTPLIERFARLKKPELPTAEVAYCRTLTKVWVGVLSANSALLLFAALCEDDAMWAVLVGPVSYGLLGFVFAVEYIYRKRRFQDFGSDPLDRCLKLILGRSSMR